MEEENLNLYNCKLYIERMYIYIYTVYIYTYIYCPNNICRKVLHFRMTISQHLKKTTCTRIWKSHPPSHAVSATLHERTTTIYKQLEALVIHRVRSLLGFFFFFLQVWLPRGKKTMPLKRVFLVSNWSCFDFDLSVECFSVDIFVCLSVLRDQAWVILKLEALKLAWALWQGTHLPGR